MLVFRVEVNGVQDSVHTHIGCGVYAGAMLPEHAPYSKLHIVLQDGTYCDMTDQPLPYEDAVLRKGYPSKFDNLEDTRFAFASVASYHRWFKSATGRKAATPWGRLQAYHVPDESVVVGEAQCLVIAAAMVPHKTLSLDYEGEYHE